MERDAIQNNGKCSLILSKAKMSNAMLGWGIAKESPYTESFNRG